MEEEKQRIIKMTSSLIQDRQKIVQEEHVMIKNARNTANQRVNELNLAFESELKEWEATSKKEIASYEKKVQGQIEEELTTLTKRYEQRKDVAFEQFVGEIFDYGNH